MLSDIVIGQVEKPKISAQGIGVFHWKCIAALSDKVIAFYAMQQTPHVDHQRIARSFKIPDQLVIGGGWVSYVDRELHCSDMSGVYRYLPNKFMVVASSRMCQHLYLAIDKIEVDMTQPNEIYDRRCIELWDKLGYPFTREKEVAYPRVSSQASSPLLR
ncbi:MAG: hypothetical protein ABIF10_07280 [Candidatus Woesearchaeota archaeon]